ncbi:MAG: hypothetical protein RL377_36 [Bacteroidota bacterium]|jgi:hypothetical protein
MSSFIKSLILSAICICLLSAFIQKDTILVKVDSTQIGVDTLAKKDTLWIKYIPVLPKTYLKSDAWFIQSLHTSIADTNINILKDYKNYYAEKRNAFQLYHKNTAVAKDGVLIYKIEQRFSLPDKDMLFYLVIGLLLFYGLINYIYPQYFPKLFSQFSQSSLRMLQNREQLLQNSVASLILNISFVLSFSLMATLLIFNNHLLPVSFWEVYLYICLFFTCLYLGKYICLELMGYIFNVRELVGTYVFVVFMINKVLGILLLPFIAILAFAKPAYYSIAIGAAAILTILLFLYRYLFSLTSVRNKLHISSFHFFLYLCAFEILPILILYKLIVQYLGGTY